MSDLEKVNNLIEKVKKQVKQDYEANIYSYLNERLETIAVNKNMTEFQYCEELGRLTELKALREFLNLTELKENEHTRITDSVQD